MKKKLLFVAALMTAATAGMRSVQAKASCTGLQLVDLQNGVTALSDEKQRPENDDTDVTSWIVNPGFDNNTLDGWTGWTDNNTVSKGYFELISDAWNKFTFDLWQEIELPCGVYKLSVQQHSAVGDKTVLYLQSGSERQVSKMDWKGPNIDTWVNNSSETSRIYTGEVLALDGKIRLGVNCFNGNPDQAIYFDNFKLTYVNDGSAKILAFRQEILGMIATNEYPTALTERFSEECVLLDNPTIEDYYTCYPLMVAFKDLLSVEAKDLRRMQDFCTQQGLAEAVAASNNSLATVRDNAGIITIRETLSAAMNTAIKENGVLIESVDFATTPENWIGGATVGNGVAEFFDRDFDYWKQCTGLLSGWYQVEVNALHVAGSNSFSQWEDKLIKNTAVIFGDNGGPGARYSVPARLRYEEDCSDLGPMGIDGKYPENVWQANTAFSADRYKTVVNVYVNGQGVLNYGLAGWKVYNTSNWICFDNFKVIYKGTDLGAMWDAMKAAAKIQAAKVSDDYASEVESWEKPDVIGETEIWQLNEKTKMIVEVANKVAEVGEALDAIPSFEELLDNSEAGSVDKTTLRGAVPAAHQTRKNHIKSVDEAQALLAQVENTRIDYLKTANPIGDYTFDMTFLLTNPEVTGFGRWEPVVGWYGDQRGLKEEGIRCQHNNDYRGETRSDAFFEHYAEAPLVAGTWTIYQKANIPVGNYEMKVAAFAGPVNNIGGTGEAKGALYVGEKRGDEVNSTTLKYGVVAFEQVAETELYLGLKMEEGNLANWAGLNDMTLTKVAPKSLTLSETSTEAPVAEDTYAHVTLERALAADKWNTFCVPFDMPADKFTEVKELTGCTFGNDGNSATLTFGTPEDGIKAGRPYIVKVETDLTSLEVGPVAVKAAAPEPVEKDGVIMQGNYTGMSVPLDAYFIRNNAFYVADTEGVNMKGFRAYIKLPGRENAGVNRLFIDIDGDVTAVENVLDGGVADSDKTVDVYTVAGVRVKSGVKKADALAGLNKGIYIVDGKKVVK